MRLLILSLALCHIAWANIEAVRLSVIPNGMVVGWTTEQQYPTAPKLSWGLTPALGQVAVGEIKTYGTKFFNYVPVANLNPSTVIYYQIDDEPVATFTTAPDNSASSYPFKFLQVGDMGLNNSQNTLSMMLQQIDEIAFAVHVGDVGYADLWQKRAGTPYDTYESLLPRISRSLSRTHCPSQNRGMAGRI